tara:strand:+ start:507 stop:1685 length:1179 start_codon:yes stop_codon:yes gene_type:complete
MATTTQIVREAEEIEAYKLGLLESAKGLSDTALDLPNQQVAGLNALQQQAIQGASQAGGIGGYQQLTQAGQDTLGTGLGTLNQATGALQNVPGYLNQSSAAAGQAGQTLQGSTQQFSGGQGYNAQGFDPNTVSSYMNPYESMAVQQALGDIRREGTIMGNQQDAQAVQAGSFGGSRQGLQASELGRNVLGEQARTAAGMRQSGFLSAMQQAQQGFEDQQRRQQAQAQFGTSTMQQAFEDQQRRQQAAASQQLGIGSLYGNLAQQQGALAGQYGNLGQAQGNLGVQQLNAGQQAQNQGLADLNAMQTMGGIQQQNTQAGLNADFANQRTQMYEPYTRLGFLSDIYKGAPTSQSSIGSQVPSALPTPSPFQQIAGLGTGLVGAAAGASQLGKLF